MKQVVNDILTSLRDEPQRWKIHGYTWHRDDGLEVWRANMPILDISIYAPYSVSIRFADKIRLWRAFRRWKNSVTLEQFIEALKK